MIAQYGFRLSPSTTIYLSAEGDFAAHVQAQAYAGGPAQLIFSKRWPATTGPRSDVPEAERVREAMGRWRERNPGYSRDEFRENRRKARAAEREMAAS